MVSANSSLLGDDFELEQVGAGGRLGGVAAERARQREAVEAQEQVIGGHAVQRDELARGVRLQERWLQLAVVAPRLLPVLQDLLAGRDLVRAAEVRMESGVIDVIPSLPQRVASRHRLLGAAQERGRRLLAE